MDFRTNFSLLTTYLLPSLIIDIFKYKNINHGIHFYCSDLQREISIQKLLQNNSIFITSLERYNMSNKLPVSYSKIGIILHSSCENWTHIFETLGNESLFKNSFIWMIITDDLSSTVNKLSYYPIEVDSDVTIAYKIEENFHLYEVYNTGFYTNGVFKVMRTGYWNSTLLIQTTRRYDLSGVVLKCMVVLTQKIVNETFENYLIHPNQNMVDSLHKLKFFTLLMYLKDMYNITYQLYRTNSWGYIRNGSFDGMVGALQRREVDIGGTPVFFRQDRAKYIDYIGETWQSRPCFILRHPKHPEGTYKIYSRPLTGTVWACILALLTLSGMILGSMLKLKALDIAGDEPDTSSSLAFLSIWSAVCQQGIAVRKDATSIKIVIFATFLFTLTLYQYYNATVVSTLLRDPPKTIRTLNDLLKSNLKAGVEDVLYNRDFFKRTTDPVALKLYDKKIVTATQYNFYIPEHGMALVKKGGFAFHVDSAIAYRIMKETFDEREICDIHEVVLYPPQNMAAVVKKGSPYKEHLTYGIRKMAESGLLRRLKKSWDETKPSCVRTPDTSVFSVSLREFATPLTVLGLGMVVAAMILAAEVFVYKVHDKKQIIKFRH